MAGAFAAGVFVVFAAVLLLLGGNWPGVVVALMVAAIWTYVAWIRSAAVVLDLTEAEPADETSHSRLFNVTSGLCAAMGVDPPALYVVDDPALNALATGTDRSNSALVVTTGALEELSVIELEGVVALELHRIKVGDTGPESFVVPTFGFSLVLSEALDRWPAVSRLLAGPTRAVLRLVARLHPGIGELDSDVAAVRYTRFPPGLASALEKMTGRSALAVGTAVTAHLWVAPPIAATTAPVAANVHAPLKDRVAVLREL